MDRPTIEQVLSRARTFAGKEVEVSELSGGLTNVNYLVAADGMKHVVRIPGRSTELLAVYRENERQWSVYNFEAAPVDVLVRRFEEHDEECRRLIELGLPLPAYDQVLKCSHAFNLLDARGAISATERAAYIRRVRNLARSVAELYVESLAQPAV